MRRLAWGAIGYTNDASLSAELAEKLFGRRLRSPLPGRDLRHVPV